MKNIGTIRLFGILLCLGVMYVCAEEGLAGKYPGDAGIDKDSDVVFAEDFEKGNLGDVLSNWTDSGETGDMTLAADVPPGSSGSKSLQMGSDINKAPYLYKAFSPGFDDKIYVRYYVKYFSGGKFHHTCCRIGSYNPYSGTPNPFGWGTGKNHPNGNQGFEVDPEPCETRYKTIDSSPKFDFYVYWMDMKPCRGGKEWYGNMLLNDGSARITPGKWTCIETMIKLNKPGGKDGELILWMDGRQIKKIGNMRWRTGAAVKINWIRPLNYVTESPGGRVAFDDLVVAKSYIGPIEFNPLDSIKLYSGPFYKGGFVRFKGLPSASITIKIFDESDKLVQDVSNRIGDMFWNGKDSKGDLAEPGKYKVRIADKKKHEKVFEIELVEKKK
ncbi:MAG: hypothetical protein V1752_02770 [Candidatus Firestonebacteria bacterium]